MEHPEKIPQIMLSFGDEEAQAACQVVESGWITEGAAAAEFSAMLNDYIGVPYGVFAPNGTLALFLGLAALGIGPGDEVLVPDITFIASANAILLAGAIPVFAEVNPDNYQIDMNQCGQLLTDRTRAVMPVHLYGMPADMTEVMRFARQNNLLVVEDAAQAIGVQYYGQYAGTFGETGCFSFFADKTITTGEGGYVVCRDREIYERLLLLRNQGRIKRSSYIHSAVGYNFRITDIQAAIGMVQLKKIDRIVEKKQEILEWYKERLSSADKVRFLTVQEGSNFIPFRIVILCEDASGLMAYLKNHGVQVRASFYPLHRQPCFAYLGKENGGPLDLGDDRYPNAVYSSEHGILLPAFPSLTKRQVASICRLIEEFYLNTPT